MLLFCATHWFLLNKRYSYRQLFWITGSLAFVFSTIIRGLAIGLLMGAVASAVGKTIRNLSL